MEIKYLTKLKKAKYNAWRLVGNNTNKGGKKENMSAIPANVKFGMICSGSPLTLFCQYDKY
jgi:hypothetical protein